jgi:hypothetical protein
VDSIYVLLLTLLLYILFGTIVDLFVATDGSTQLLQIRLKVFFHTFVAPIIFGFVILFVILTDNKSFNVFFGIGLILGSLIRAFFGERKYLTNLSLGNTHIEIKYLTSLLTIKNYNFDLADITNIEIEKANWLIDFPASITVYSKDTSLKFYLVNKRMKLMIQSNIAEANVKINASQTGGIDSRSL